MKEKCLNCYIKGGQIPNGKIRVSGAKNAATKLLAASLISDEVIKFTNFPINLVDVEYKIEFIRRSGGLIFTEDESETIEINPKALTCSGIGHYNYPIRTTYLLAAGFLKRCGIARIPYPGGCKIGSRGYDLHIMVWRALGAIVLEKENYIEISAPDGLRPSKINFPILSIGGTENALITASIIEGSTTITNAYISPETENLIQFLRTMGVQIEVNGNSFIRIHGKRFLRGSLFQVIPDRIEALTWLVYGAISKGSITIEDVPFSSMAIPLMHIKEAGVDYYQSSSKILISPDCLQSGVIQPFEVSCGTHPGVISDMQPFFTLLGLHGAGISRIYDYRYPERIQYCSELAKFYGDRIIWESGKITVNGDGPPQGCIASSTDLRGSMALIIAALVAKGNSEIKNAEMALRGYNNLQLKLKRLGVEINLDK